MNGQEIKVPGDYREKTYILPPVYYSGTLYCCPFSSAHSLNTFYRIYFYGCEPMIKYGKIIFQGIQSICIIKVHTSQYYVIYYKSTNKHIDQFTPASHVTSQVQVPMLLHSFTPRFHPINDKYYPVCLIPSSVVFLIPG